MSKKTKISNVLNHMKNHKSINPMQALNMYGLYRLSSTIHVLRNRGFEIETVIRTSQKGDTYAEYSLNQ
jgi:hypothetical protein